MHGGTSLRLRSHPAPNNGVQARAAWVRCAPAARRAWRLAFGFLIIDFYRTASAGAGRRDS
jgi:hypothetical protein